MADHTRDTNHDDLPSHASPVIAPQPFLRPPAPLLTAWADLANTSQPATPGVPHNLISPAYTPPLTPSLPLSPGPGVLHSRPPTLHEPKSIPVDTSLDDENTKQPRLVQRLPQVECQVRARIPTTTGAEMFLHLYTNDSDNKEHLAIVFGNTIRSRSLDAERPGDTEWQRMVRGAYVGRLRPGRISSRKDDMDDLRRKVLTNQVRSRSHSGSVLRNVVNVDGTTAAAAADQVAAAPRVQDGSQADPAASLPSAPAPAAEDGSKPPLVRIHSECYTGETAWSARCDCGEQLDEAARLMSTPNSLHGTHDPQGVIVYLRQEGRGIGLASKLMAYNLQDLGSDTVEANLLLRHPADARTYGLATAILVDLGLGTDTDEEKAEHERGIRLLTNNPDKVRAVEGPNKEVRVKERVAMVPISWKTHGQAGVRGIELQRYLETKMGRMGHMIHEP